MSLNLSSSAIANFARFPVQDYGHHEPVDTGRYRKLFQNVQHLENVSGQVLCNTLLTSSIIVTGSTNAGTIALGTYYLAASFGPFPVIKQSRFVSGSINIPFPLLYITFNGSSGDGNPVQFYFSTRAPSAPPIIPALLSPGQFAYTQVSSSTNLWFELNQGYINVFSGTPTLVGIPIFTKLIVASTIDEAPIPSRTYSGSTLDEITDTNQIIVDCFIYFPTSSPSTIPGAILKGVQIVERSLLGQVI